MCVLPGSVKEEGRPILKWVVAVNGCHATVTGKKKRPDEHRPSSPAFLTMGASRSAVLCPQDPDFMSHEALFVPSTCEPI